MKPAVVESFEYRVRVIEHAWIAMPDGVRLSARIWLPEGAGDVPVPAILEYIPYRKGDFTAVRDSLTHPYLAGHGYACVRVDLRGSGDSEGVLTDEYLPQELDDGVRVIEWIAAQPWCDGSVGMIGISWGGFNGLQIAALQPQALKAVVTVSSTDDRYADDVHYMGGCLLGDNLSWASVMFAYNSLPPNPEVVGENWRDMWMQRLEESGLWIDTWLRHQRRDEYWRHGSICEDFSAVRVPVLAASGWADGYSNAVFRLMEQLPGPRKGLIGPWSHKYPHVGLPGPAIGFLQEVLRWFDHWMKGRDSGVMEEPMLRLWMQDSVPPTIGFATRSGRWVGEPSWPSPHIRDRKYALTPAGLVDEELGPEESGAILTIQSPLFVGLFAGKWCSYAAGPDLAHDQRQEDGGALVFDTLPLEQTVEIVGAPEVVLEFESDQPVAMVAVRLSDVAPTDEATRVTYGLINATHRDSHADPTPLEPGRRYQVRILMNGVAQVFPRGHRLRLSLSTSYWPLAWPPPRPARLRVHLDGSSLSLPVRPRRDAEDEKIAFQPPETARPLPSTMLEPVHHNWRVMRNLASDVSTLEVVKDEGAYRLDDSDVVIRHKTLEWYQSTAGNFDSVRGETRHHRGLSCGDWDIQTITRTVMTADADNFYVRADLDAWEGERRVFARSWDRVIKRDLA